MGRAGKIYGNRKIEFITLNTRFKFKKARLGSCMDVHLDLCALSTGRDCSCLRSKKEDRELIYLLLDEPNGKVAKVSACGSLKLLTQLQSDHEEWRVFKTAAAGTLHLRKLVTQPTTALWDKVGNIGKGRLVRARRAGAVSNVSFFCTHLYNSVVSENEHLFFNLASG